MSQKYEWYVNGKLLKGNDAREYLEKKMNQLSIASKRIEETLKRCNTCNVIENNKSLTSSVMETAEHLSIIELELEMLLEELQVTLD